MRQSTTPSCSDEKRAFVAPIYQSFPQGARRQRYDLREACNGLRYQRLGRQAWAHSSFSVNSIGSVRKASQSCFT